jgi:NADPH:quinone reductase
MHAIRQHAFGGPETLSYEEVPDLEPGEGQVRIAVDAAGVHLIDTTIRSGQTGGPYPVPDLPMTPGREVAGRVDRVGPGVDAAWVGRRIVAHLGPASGGYAEQARAAVTALHGLPDHLSAEAAVAMIGTGRTTMGILEVADLSAKDVVLITAAAGGIGSLLVQAARAAGAVTVGVAGGPAKVRLVLDLGADVAVDYREPGWPDLVRAELGDRGDRPITALLDGVGGAAGQAALDLVGPGGRVVMFGLVGRLPPRTHHGRPLRPRHHRQRGRGPPPAPAARGPARVRGGGPGRGGRGAAHAGGGRHVPAGGRRRRSSGPRGPGDDGQGRAHPVAGVCESAIARSQTPERGQDFM